MSLSIIVAVADNFVIGKNNDMPWHLPRDLKHFKSVTLGHPVLMGRRTFESLPGGALPNRRNLVISRNTSFSAPGVEVFSSLEKALEEVPEDIFVIGGGSIYKQALPLCDKLYLTKVHDAFEDADTFFPEINWDEWELMEEEFHHADEKNPYDMTFSTYKRK